MRHMDVGMQMVIMPAIEHWTAWDLVLVFLMWAWPRRYLRPNDWSAPLPVSFLLDGQHGLFLGRHNVTALLVTPIVHSIGLRASSKVTS